MKKQQNTKQTLNNFAKETIKKTQTIKGGPRGSRGTETTVQTS